MYCSLSPLYYHMVVTNYFLEYDQFFETKNTPRSGNSLEIQECVWYIMAKQGSGDNIKIYICGLSREIKVLWGINGL